MFFHFLFATIFVASAFSENAKVRIVEENLKTSDGNEYETEIVAVELKKPNEDITFVAKVRIHLIKGNVHVNGHFLQHNHVHQITMMVNVIDVVKGIQQVPKRRSVVLRVMIQDTNINNVHRLLVEEEFIAIGETTVEQIDVHQIMWESNIRKPITTVKLVESTIHKKPREQDHHLFIRDEMASPHLPEHGFGYDVESDGHHHHHGHDKHHHHCHHHHHHHHNGTVVGKRMHKVKCWYGSLSWKSKMLLFSIGFFGLLTTVICCALCAKRRRARRALTVEAPLDDSVSVDADNATTVKGEKGKKDGNKYEFHFEFDNSVVVDDKKNLIEE